jgi:hypothetical protein
MACQPQVREKARNARTPPLPAANITIHSLNLPMARVAYAGFFMGDQ